MEDAQVKLLSEQLGRLTDQLEARFQRLEATINHRGQLDTERMAAIKDDIADLKTCTSDHENRIRTLNDLTTSIKTSTSIAQAAQAALTLTAAAVAAWLGSRQ